MNKITYNGQEFDADAAANLMDNEIRESLTNEWYVSEQEFFDAYVAAHREKYGCDFVVN